MRELKQRPALKLAMQRIGKLAPGLALAGLVLLAGCNSTDALTPPMDVGGGTAQSPPVTQQDLDRMSADSEPVTRGQPMGQRLDQASAMSGAPSAGSAGSLEAQADALSRSPQNPVASGGGGTVVDDPTPRHEQPEGTDAPMRAATSQPQAPAQQNQGQPQGQAQAQGQTQTAAVSPNAGGESIRFLPIIGAPVEAVTPLSRQLGAQARANGLTIKSSSDNSSRHILKGYFSAMSDGRKTTVVYVWDVLDGSGARLHRIQGQDSVEATAKDPWTAVPAGTMEAIAQRTIQEYLSWKRQGGG